MGGSGACSSEVGEIAGDYVPIPAGDVFRSPFAIYWVGTAFGRIATALEGQKEREDPMESAKPRSTRDPGKDSTRSPQVFVESWKAFNVAETSLVSRINLKSWSVLLVIATLAGAAFLLIPVRRSQAGSRVAENKQRVMAASSGEQPWAIGDANTRHLKIAHMRNQLEAIFSREPIDADWTERTRQLVRGHVGDVIPEGSSPLSIECRRSVCRIEVAHKDAADSKRFVDQAFRDRRTRLWKEPYFSAVRADSTDDKVVTISYVARDGAVGFLSSRGK